MILTHKIRLNPTEEQKCFFIQAAGTARFTYNWALDQWNRITDAGGTTNGNALKMQFNALRREQFPWTYEVHRDATAQPFNDLDRAFKRFEDIQKGKIRIHTNDKPRQDGREKGYPRFKSKKRTRPSFYIANDKFVLDEHWVRIPKCGWVNMAETLRFDGKIMGARVCQDGLNWFISIRVEITVDTAYWNDFDPTGIDVGISKLMTLSDGNVAENQRTTLVHQRQLRRLNKKLSRQVEGSHNWWKTVYKLRALHTKIRNQRQDYLHKWTSYIATSYGIIGIENLNVAGMMRNKNLAKHIADASFGETFKFLAYKQYLYGSALIEVDRFFPSTKMCSDCQSIQEINLSDRVYCCGSCGMTKDRDLNAAINIMREAVRLALECRRPVLARSDVKRLWTL